MLNLARQLLVIATVASSVLVTAAVSLTAKKSSPLLITRGNAFQELENTAMRTPNRVVAQRTGKRGRKGYKLLVRTEAPPDNPKGAPRLTLTLRNESQGVIYIVESGRPRDFKLEMKDHFGKSVSPKDERSQDLVVNEGKHSLDAVNPGQEVSYTVNLDDLYSLPRGQYILTAKRFILLGDKRTAVEVTSAPVRFVVSSR